jgi:hypothetical protein
MESDALEMYPSEHAQVKGYSCSRSGTAVIFGTPSAYSRVVTIRKALFVTLAAFLMGSTGYALANSAVYRSQDQQPKKDSKAKADSKEQAASLTGCVDEQDGKWVLVKPQTMTIIATLAADGFPTEGFAKYVGQKVTVRGTSSAGASSSPFKVRTIETVSETCSAQ